MGLADEFGADYQKFMEAQQGFVNDMEKIQP